MYQKWAPVGEWKSAEVAAIADEADVVVPRGNASFAALPRELTVGGAIRRQR